MLYEFAHIVKQYLGALWNVAERCNSIVFNFRYGNRLALIDKLLSQATDSPYEMRALCISDIESLVAFFKAQPAEAFRFFKPHSFDAASLRRIVRNKSFLTFLVLAENKIVGYCFMRSFVNGASYRGYMVDSHWRGKGIAKIMGMGMNSVGMALGLKMYKSISPENVASMMATKSVCEIKVLRTLKNGDCLMECKAKKTDEHNNCEIVENKN